MGIGVGKQTYTIRGDYVVFAFSFDVALGTDYPFSGVFWNDRYSTELENIDITLGGTCRSASITINVGDKTVVDETNCYYSQEIEI